MGSKKAEIIDGAKRESLFRFFSVSVFQLFQIPDPLD